MKQTRMKFKITVLGPIKTEVWTCSKSAMYDTIQTIMSNHKVDTLMIRISEIRSFDDMIS